MFTKDTRFTRLVAVSLLVLGSGCRSTAPVKFYGKGFTTYLETKKVRPPALSGAWKLVSLNGEVAPYGISLKDLDLTLTFEQNISDSVHCYTGHGVINNFGGKYESDSTGNMSVLTMGGTKVGVGGDLGSIESEFMRLAKQAVEYEIVDTTLRLRIQEQFIELRAVILN